LRESNSYKYISAFNGNFVIRRGQRELYFCETSGRRPGLQGTRACTRILGEPLFSTLWGFLRCPRRISKQVREAAYAVASRFQVPFCKERSSIRFDCKKSVWTFV